MSTNRRLFAFGAALLGGLGLAGRAAAQPSSSGSEATLNQQRLSAAVSFIPLPRTTAPVMVRGTPSGTIVCEASLDVPDAALRTRINAMAPRLRDSLRQALSTYAAIHYRPNSAPDPDHIGRLLQVAMDTALGQAGARVLITDLMVQAQIR
jgi:hypothetical protein